MIKMNPYYKPVTQKLKWIKEELRIIAEINKEIIKKPYEENLPSSI